MYIANWSTLLYNQCKTTVKEDECLDIFFLLNYIQCFEQNGNKKDSIICIREQCNRKGMFHINFVPLYIVFLQT